MFSVLFSYDGIHSLNFVFSAKREKKMKESLGVSLEVEDKTKQCFESFVD